MGVEIIGSGASVVGGLVELFQAVAELTLAEYTRSEGSEDWEVALEDVVNLGDHVVATVSGQVLRAQGPLAARRYLDDWDAVARPLRDAVWNAARARAAAEDEAEERLFDVTKIQRGPFEGGEARRIVAVKPGGWQRRTNDDPSCLQVWYIGEGGFYLSGRMCWCATMPQFIKEVRDAASSTGEPTEVWWFGTGGSGPTRSLWTSLPNLRFIPEEQRAEVALVGAAASINSGLLHVDGIDADELIDDIHRAPEEMDVEVTLLARVIVVAINQGLPIAIPAKDDVFHLDGIDPEEKPAIYMSSDEYAEQLGLHPFDVSQVTVEAPISPDAQRVVSVLSMHPGTSCIQTWAIGTSGFHLTGCSTYRATVEGLAITAREWAAETGEPTRLWWFGTPPSGLELSDLDVELAFLPQHVDGVNNVAAEAIRSGRMDIGSSGADGILSMLARYPLQGSAEACLIARTIHEAVLETRAINVNGFAALHVPVLHIDDPHTGETTEADIQRASDWYDEVLTSRGSRDHRSPDTGAFGR